MRLLTLVFFLAALPFTARAADQLSHDLMFFYQAPSAERAVTLFNTFTKSPAVKIPNAHPPIVGFLASVFQTYPETIEKISVPESEVPLSWSLATALKLAGQTEKSDEIVARLHARGAATGSDIPYRVRLQDLSPQTPTDFDILWGATFATGDPRYVPKILGYYASVATTEDVTNDVLAAIEGFSKKQDLQWLREKYGQEGIMPIAFAMTALWAASSNARRHDFVRDAYKKYVKEHLNTPAGKGAACAATAGCQRISDLQAK